MESRPTADLARKVIASLKFHVSGRVITHDAVKAARNAAAEIAKEINKSFVDEPPSHSVYVKVNTAAMSMLEAIQELPDLEELVQSIDRAERQYNPSGPPVSPLTRMFFWCWALWDLPAGTTTETFGSIMQEVGQSLGMDGNFLSVLTLLSQSRLGLHVLEESDGSRVVLRELVNGERRRCVQPTGRHADEGELWLCRVLPPPTPAFQESVVLTPYVIMQPGVGEWEEFLARTSPRTGLRDSAGAYAALMKSGLGPRYWVDYVCEAFANHQTDAIFLRGLPDVDSSRPRSRINRDGD